jgi:hypothetical protein
VSFQKMIVWLSFVCLASTLLALADEQQRTDISIVISAIGGPNVDGEREDLSWIPRNLTKQVHIYHSTKAITKHLYQRTKKTKLHFLGNVDGNDCLAYLKFIISNYEDLPRWRIIESLTLISPRAILCLRADAGNRCPSIRSILEKQTEDLSSLIHDPRRSIPGYMPLTRASHYIHPLSSQ